MATKDLARITQIWQRAYRTFPARLALDDECAVVGCTDPSGISADTRWAIFFASVGEFEPRQYRQIIGDDAALHVSDEALFAAPIGASKTEGALEHGDVRFDAGSEITQFLKHPFALDHIANLEATSLRKADVLYAKTFGVRDVFFRGETTIGANLSRWPAKDIDLVFDERREQDFVRWVAVLIGRGKRSGRKIWEISTRSPRRFAPRDSLHPESGAFRMQTK